MMKCNVEYLSYSFLSHILLKYLLVLPTSNNPRSSRAFTIVKIILTNGSSVMFIDLPGLEKQVDMIRDHYFPNDSKASSSLGPFDVTSSTKKVDTRARARAISLKISNTSTNQSWRLGTFRLDIQPDGRR